jgi:hypothetical protein
MTPIGRSAILRRVKDITLGSTLGLALLNGSVGLQSCGNNDRQSGTSSGKADDYAVGTTERFGRGVLTFITETAPGQFRITDEKPVDPAQAGAVVRYYDGHRDSLSVDAAKRLVQTDSGTSRYLNNPSSYAGYHRNGLSNALLWGGLGYMLGRQSGPQFRNDEQRYGAGVYANRGVYDRTSGLRETVRSSRTVTSRPSGSRSGFFNRSRGFGSRG